MAFDKMRPELIDGWVRVSCRNGDALEGIYEFMDADWDERPDDVLTYMVLVVPGEFGYFAIYEEDIERIEPIEGRDPDPRGAGATP